MSVTVRPAKLDFEYDPIRDVLTIEGKQYSGELFRMWGDDEGLGLYDGACWINASRKGGPVTVTAYRDLEKPGLDAMQERAAEAVRLAKLEDA